MSILHVSIFISKNKLTIKLPHVYAIVFLRKKTTQQKNKASKQIIPKHYKNLKGLRSIKIFVNGNTLIEKINKHIANCQNNRLCRERKRERMLAYFLLAFWIFQVCREKPKRHRIFRMVSIVIWIQFKQVHNYVHRCRLLAFLLVCLCVGRACVCLYVIHYRRQWFWIQD